jgi:hypothetical protein
MKPSRLVPTNTDSFTGGSLARISRFQSCWTSKTFTKHFGEFWGFEFRSAQSGTAAAPTTKGFAAWKSESRCRPAQTDIFGFGACVHSMPKCLIQSEAPPRPKERTLVPGLVKYSSSTVGAPEAVGSATPASLAKPKSSIFARPLSVTNMLAGLMSR